MKSFPKNGSYMIIDWKFYYFVYFSTFLSHKEYQKDSGSPVCLYYVPNDYGLNQTKYATLDLILIYKMWWYLQMTFYLSSYPVCRYCEGYLSFLKK